MILPLVTFGCYVLLIGWLLYGYAKVPTYASQKTVPKTHISIIIPFRNEATVLPALLDSLQKLAYPKELFEIILVDDHSTDDFLEIIRVYQEKITNLSIISNVRVSGSPKKDAINSAINIAKGTWILTTDADCELPSLWLQTLDAFIQEHRSEMVAGPITLKKNKKAHRLLQAYEFLDVSSLLGATVGGFGIRKPFMANGANLAYSKAVFKEVNGFQANDHIASGDDLFLLQKFVARDASKVHYLKSEEYLVETNAQENWPDFVQQRKRWASKSTRYTQFFPKIVGLVIFITNLVMAISLLKFGLLVIGSFKAVDGISPFQLLGVLVLKTAFDLTLIWQALTLNKGMKWLGWYPLIAIIYPFVSSYIGLLAFTRTYTWKGRTFKT